MDELRAQIERFEIDEPGTRVSFATKLARQGGWSREYADRVIREYRRFIYMAMVADHMVSPSEDVDQAWHLHLLYTASYWERLIPQLPRPLHHHPSKGGSDQDAKFEDLYKRTMATYHSLFGEEAPSDIWPSAERRFGKDLRWQRVNLVDHWVVPKAKARQLLGWAGTATIVAVGVGCTPLLAQTEAGADATPAPSRLDHRARCLGSQPESG